MKDKKLEKLITDAALAILIIVIINFGILHFKTNNDFTGENKVEIKEVIVKEEYKKDLELNKAVRNSYIPVKTYLTANHTGDSKITEAILRAALENEIPVTVAFGLAWSESRFDPRAKNGIHNRNGTSDWGLFQLNDAYRSNWNTGDFFDPYKNANEAMDHLRNLMDRHGDNMVICLAAYNAGSRGIKKGVSYNTLMHINNILNYSNKLEEKINEVVVK